MHVVVGEPKAQTSRWLARAWVAVGLFPVTLVAVGAGAFAFYDAMRSNAIRAESGQTTLPLWVEAVVWIIGTAIVLAPCAAAVVFGRRANADGDPRGNVPSAIGAVAGLGYALLSIISMVGGHL